MAARIATPHSQRENATLIPSGVRTQAASHPSGCKDSANRTKNQIYLDFSEMQPLQRHTLREFFPCEKDSEYFAQNEEIYEKFWKSQKKFLSLQPRTMDVFHLLGLGCPRSEELSGSWRLFFLCLLGWIDFEPQKLSILHKYIGGQYVVG